MTDIDKSRPVLYSTNTWIAYQICEQYYSQKHYVWCTPFFDGNSKPNQEFSLPPSSTPRELGRRLYEEVRLGDRHSAKIKENRRGIVKGAKYKHAAGMISHDQMTEIISIVDQASLLDFRPLLYIIPTLPVQQLLKKVPVKRRAHPLSDEYIIEELPRIYFDVISFPGVII